MNSQYLKVGGFCLQLQLPPNQFRIIGCFSFDCYDTGIDWTVLKRYRLVRSAKLLSLGNTSTARDTAINAAHREKHGERRSHIQFQLFHFEWQYDAQLFFVPGLYSRLGRCDLCPGLHGWNRLGGHVGTHRLTTRSRLAIVIRYDTWLGPHPHVLIYLLWKKKKV